LKKKKGKRETERRQQGSIVSFREQNSGSEKKVDGKIQIQIQNKKEVCMLNKVGEEREARRQ
jgi:hypothetical protein